jgi:hypothetical protein
MKKIIFSLALFSFLIIACSKSSEDTMPPAPAPGPGTCDTANMKYVSNVVPILQANCYSCHGTTTNSGSNGNVLEGYSNLKSRVDNGKLIGSITHASGFTPMPYLGVKMSACNINIITSWVNNGAKDN